MKLASRLFVVAAAAALQTCTPGQVWYFLMIIDPADTRAPPSCFQAADVPNPGNLDQALAEAFCGINQAPGTDTGNTTTMKARLLWTVWEGAEGKWYLEQNESTADANDEAAPVMEGQLKNGKHTFSRTDERWDHSDEQRKMTATTVTTIELEIGGGNATGSVSTSRTFTCEGSRCASDFSARCPPCSFPYPVAGRQVSAVEEHNVGR